MLSGRERRYVAEHIRSSDHDYFTWAPLSGEPFLTDGVLCYFDGVCVEVVGIPLEAATGSPEAETRRLAAVVRAWSARPAVTIINYCGPWPVRGPNGRAWRVTYRERPRKWNQEVFVDLRSPVCDRRKVRQDVRRAGRQGLTVTVRRLSVLGHEHIGLLSRLARRDTLEVPDVLFLTNVNAILRSRATRVFEVRAAGLVVGFAVAHGYFRPTAFMVVAAFDRAVRGASDLLYERVLSYYRDRGMRELGLGPAVDEGSFRYKTKWGAVRLGPPVRHITWERPQDAPPTRDCLHWPWRMLAARADA